MSQILTRRPAPVNQLHAVASAPFPGRWFGAAATIGGPLLLLSGILLRMRFDFFFPEQLAAYDDHPTLMSWSYGLFTLGVVLLIPAALAVAQGIAAASPKLAVWGASMTVLGLIARIFHAGVDHLAFQLVDVQGQEAAHRAVADSYGATYVLQVANPMNMVGWILLAVGAWRARTLHPVLCVALGSMSLLMLGVLKGTNTVSIVIAAALCVALVPYGWRLLRSGPRPAAKELAGWTAAVVVVLGVMVFLGQAG